jgi:hypothetical protein
VSREQKFYGTVAILYGVFELLLLGLLWNRLNGAGCVIFVLYVISMACRRDAWAKCKAVTP